MRAKPAILMSLLVFAATGAVAAPLESSPGYVDIDGLGLGNGEEPTVEVNLSGALLKLGAIGARDEDPELEHLIANLDGITIRVFEIEDSDDDFDAQVAAVSKQLEQRGWETIVKVRERDERVHIAVKVVDEKVVGLTVVALDSGTHHRGDELVFVNIVGDIDVDQIGRLGRHMDIDALDSLNRDDFKSVRQPKKK